MKIYLIALFSVLVSTSAFATSLFILDQNILELNDEIPQIIDTHLSNTFDSEDFRPCICMNDSHKHDLFQSIIHISLAVHKDSKIQTPKLVPAMIVGHLLDFGFGFSKNCLTPENPLSSRDEAINFVESQLDKNLPATPAA